MFENYFLHVMHWHVGSGSFYMMIAIQNKTQRARKLARFASLDALIKAFHDTGYIDNATIEQARKSLTEGGNFTIQDIALGDKELHTLGLTVWE